MIPSDHSLCYLYDSLTVKGSMERSDNPTLEEKVYSEYIIFCSSNKSFNSFTIYRKIKATCGNQKLRYIANHL